MQTISRLPGNDLILWTTYNINPFLWIGLFSLFNYTIIILLISFMKNRSDNLIQFRKDWFYHLFWIIIVPCLFVFIFPIAYSGLRDSFILSKQLVSKNKDITQNKDTSTKINEAVKSHDSIRNSKIVSVSTGCLSLFITLVVWPYVLKRTTRSEANGWMMTNRQITFPGLFFLLMCSSVVWCGLIFVVNAINDHVLLVRLFFSVKYLDLDTTVDNSMYGLRPIQDSIIIVMVLWFIAFAIGYYFAWDRRRGRCVAEGQRLHVDWMPVIYITLTIVVLCIFMIPIVFIHSALFEHKEFLYSQAASHPDNISYEKQAALYPTWPVDWSFYVTLLPFIAGLIQAARWAIDDIHARLTINSTTQE